MLLETYFWVQEPKKKKNFLFYIYLSLFQKNKEK